MKLLKLANVFINIQNLVIKKNRIMNNVITQEYVIDYIFMIGVFYIIILFYVSVNLMLSIMIINIQYMRK